MVLSKFKESIIDLLFPPRCVGCGSGGSFLCPSCIRLLPRLYPPYCERCSIPIIRGTLCPTCLRSPPIIDGIRSLFWYQRAIRDAILWFKYKNLKALASPLAELMAEYLRSNPLPIDILVAVPLHPKRIRQRGYNQSYLLARELSRLSGLVLMEGSLIRLRDTTSQTILGAQERRSNVRGAFECKDQRLAGKRIGLIDDVCTTGSTLDACAAVLKERGGSSVWGLTLAREN